MVRPAVAADIPAILTLIRELAVHQGGPDSVEATEDSLFEVLFGRDPQVFAHVAEVEGEVVGLAVWFVSFSTWTGRHGIYLEDLVVSERARSGGHGRALITELARICVDRGYRRLEWAVLDWNTDAQRFYASIGAAPHAEQVPWRLSGEELIALAASS